MNPKIGRDLLDRHTIITVASHLDDIVTELSGVGLGQSNILPTGPNGAMPTQMSAIRVADPHV